MDKMTKTTMNKATIDKTALDGMTIDKTAADVLYLARCLIRGETPDKERVGAMDIDSVLALAARHKLGAICATALEQAGFADARTGQAITASVRRTLIFENALQELKPRLNAAGIWFMPLKGAILKDLYPGIGMREFADYDVLFDKTRAEEVKTIMESMGFHTSLFGNGVHDVYTKKPVLNFEMHQSLFGESDGDAIYAYYQEVETHLLPGEGCERHFSPEDFYLYFLSHAYKHYEKGGIGIRALLDTYVYLTNVSLDTAYVAAEAEKLKIREFEEKNRALSMHLFGDEALSEAGAEMLSYMLSSGAYGTISHRVHNKMEKAGMGRFRYMLSRFFVPVRRSQAHYEAFAARYPVFYKYKILLPLLPFYRVFFAIKKGKFGAEAKAILREKP